MKHYIFSALMLLSLVVINKSTFATEADVVPSVEQKAAVLPAEEIVIDEEDETVKTEESIPAKIDTK